MTYIIGEACIDLKDISCQSVCPVDCIHEVDRMLVIDAEECIDCGACEPECPVEAILPEDAIPDDWEPFVKINYAFISRSPTRARPRSTRSSRPTRTRRGSSPTPERRGLSESFYMACLDLTGRRCVVVGGGTVGLEKAAGLVTCGAQVTVVSPGARRPVRRARDRVAARPVPPRATCAARSS